MRVWADGGFTPRNGTPQKIKMTGSKTNHEWRCIPLFKMVIFHCHDSFRRGEVNSQKKVVFEIKLRPHWIPNFSISPFCLTVAMKKKHAMSCNGPKMSSWAQSSFSMISFLSFLAHFTLRLAVKADLNRRKGAAGPRGQRPTLPREKKKSRRRESQDSPSSILCMA